MLSQPKSKDGDRVRGAAAGLIAVSVLALILDGVDQQVLPLAAPLILKEWAITRSEMGEALVGALVGLAAGTVLGGYLGDRFGKMRVMIASMVIFGLATGALSCASNVTHIAVLRFIGGTAFGAVVPNAMALVSLSVPAKIRPTVIGLLVLSVPIGMALAAVLSSWLLPAVGWRTMFLLAGIPPVLLAASATLLLKREPNMNPADIVVAASPKKVSWQGEVDDEPAGLLAPRRRLATIGLWLLFFANGCTAALTNWLPVMVTDAGFSVQNAGQVTFLYTAAALAGTGIAATSYRFFAAWKVAVVSVLGVLGAGSALIVVIGLSLQSSVQIVALMTMVGVGIGGTQASCYVLASSLYPERTRAFGIGAGASFNRIGGIVTVLMGGILLEATRGDPRLFLGQVMTLMLFGLGGVLLVGRGIAKSGQG